MVAGMQVRKGGKDAQIECRERLGGQEFGQEIRRADLHHLRELPTDDQGHLRVLNQPHRKALSDVGVGSRPRLMREGDERLVLLREREPHLLPRLIDLELNRHPFLSHQRHRLLHSIPRDLWMRRRARFSHRLGHRHHGERSQQRQPPGPIHEPAGEEPRHP